MTEHNNPPAFPTKQPLSSDFRGMSLLDHFAGLAMQGMIAAPMNEHGESVASLLSDGVSYSGGWRGRIAASSYEMANAMLKERQKWVK